MHPRNIYREGIDFVQLSASFPPLAKYLDLHKTIDFKDQDAQRCLTEALLYTSFRLKIRLAPDRLCPPVLGILPLELVHLLFCSRPYRLNYVLWIQDLVRASRYLESDIQPQIRGIDIGTGASAIYPLLACRMDDSWNFVASEIDGYSFQSAQENISANNLDDRIQLVQSDTNLPILLPLFLDKYSTFEFTMCNPPFYSSVEDVAQSAEAKQYGPNAVCTGAEVEMITAGGESAFVGKMVKESLDVRQRCRWYTSMLGKLTSVEQVVSLLSSNSIDNYLLTEFVQGQTRRWAVGWSFSDIRLPDSVSRLRNPNPIISRCMPAHNTMLQPVSFSSVEDLHEALSGVLSSINSLQVQRRRDDLSTTEMNTEDNVQVEYLSGFLILARQDTWSRSARRRQKQFLVDADADAGAPSETSMAMACSVHIKEHRIASESTSVSVKQEKELAVEFNWRKGRDRGLFDSFCSHVSRKIISVHG